MQFSLAKPSRPSRAYLHLTEQAHVVPLADKVRKTAFTDAKNSTRDPALIGPPTVDFAPFNRIPGGRRRNDARQGLIDQDPEFKDFLESLTNPVPKSAPVDNAADEVAVKKDEVRTTPLIEHLREKKAAKEKPQPAKAQGKHGRGESKDEKAASKSEKKGRKGAKEEKSSKQSKAEKAAKESAPKEVKILNKASAGKNTESEKKDENKSTSGAPASERKRERGSASIAKQMLQRDLGIGPAAGGRRSRRDTAQEPAKTAAETTAAKDSAAVSPALSSPATPAPTAPAKTSSEARSGKKDSRPTRAERRAQKAAKASAEAASTDENKPTATPPAGPKILKKPQNGQQNNQKAAPAASLSPSSKLRSPSSVLSRRSRSISAKASRTSSSRNRTAYRRQSRPAPSRWPRGPSKCSSARTRRPPSSVPLGCRLRDLLLGQ
ncbi:Regulator of nonsense-mediated decay UPF3 [Macrophomina phaseolina MS6]|uniref:Regulator of nonsense-mediated decay UPF3 n=1 Tax=Macrophomina phaseolina (strain MS6) TaxID=1126212 RepID=K2S2E0_MACPH|nr:Regulator of nonsense-mediated decay UPF3 [Macrophomina phaseolina MS6]